VLTVSLTISNNDYLADLSALCGLNNVGLNIDINNNAALATLTDLSGITSVGGHLQIYNNDILRDGYAVALHDQLIGFDSTFYHPGNNGAEPAP
jgi:hypothetical protein